VTLPIRKLFLLLVALTVLVSLVFALAISVKAQTLSVQILSYDHIGIDANKPENEGPDQANVQARISNNGTEAVTNVVAAFQWTSSNPYVILSPYEALVKSLGDLAPGQSVDVFWVVDIARDLNAKGTTRSFRIDVTSDQTSATATQTLTVEGLTGQSQSYSNIVNVPSSVSLGDTFIVEAEATVSRNIAHLAFPLLFDRSLFELEHVQLDYYISSDFSSPVSLTEYDIYYTDPDGSIDYGGVRAFYTLRAVRAGTGTFASLQLDANKNESSFDYNSTIWAGSMDVVAANPAVVISKMDSPDPVLAGSNITYSITYGNTGNADAINVVVTDYIPTYTSYVSGSASGEPGVTIEYYDGSVWSATEPSAVEAIRWIVGTLAVGVSGQQAGFQVTVDPGVAVGTLIGNTATITSDQINSAEGAITTVGSPPNPVISKIDWPDPVEPGAIITYTITYGNSGAAAASNVTITDSVPTNTTYVSGSASGEPGVTIEYYDGSLWSATEPTTVEAIRWIVGTLSAGVTGQQARFQVVVAPNVAGGTFIENTAIITSDQTPQSAVQITTVANQPPVAVDDGPYSVDEDNTLSVAALGVLGNDSDAEGTPLTAILVDDVSDGTLTLNADGSFTYTPAPDFNGSDSFTYKANDGAADSNIATVTITVNPVNDTPVANEQSAETPEDTPVDITLIGSDMDGDPLSFIITTLPTHGSLAEGGSAITTTPYTLTGATITYTPTLSYNGADSFTFKVNDGTVDSNIATVNITINPVNDAPVANDDAYSVDEDNPLNVSAPGVLGNDTDVENDPLTAVLVSDVSNGTLTLNSNGSFTYTPDLDFTGTDSFTYRAYDGSDYSNVATVTITAGPANDPPVANDDAYAVDEDDLLNVAAPGVLGNDMDLDNDSLTAVVVSDVSNGTLVLNGDGSFTYTPDADFSGMDSFTYQAYDGTDYSNVATVTIMVNPVNDAPVANDDGYSIDEDNPLNVAAPGVLGNDSDVENDPLTAVLVGDVSNGTLNLSSNGSFTYMPDLDFTGTDSFTYWAYDGSDYSNVTTVTITVNAVNDAPIANNDAYGVDEDGTLIIPAPGVLSNDTDVENDPLTATLVSEVSNGTLNLSSDGSFAYTPDADFNGTDSFSYQAYDGIDYSNVVTVVITVNPVNDAPMAVNDAYSVAEGGTLNVPSLLGVLANDTDAENNPLTAILVGGPSHGMLILDGDGSFIYKHDGSETTSDSFTYKANDGAADSNIATVTITVNPGNDAPVAEAGGPYTGNEGSAITFNASASRDVDGAITLYEWDWDYDGDYDESTTSPTITHTWSDDYSSMVRLRVTDNGGATATDIAAVTVNNVAPTAEAGGPYSGREGLAITLSGSATDPGTDALSYAWDLDNNGSYETLGQSVSNIWSQAGTYTVRLKVTDDDGGEGFDTATVNVQGLLHISGLVQDLGAISLEGITFYLKDQAGNAVGMDISAPQPPNPDYDIECYPGTYDLVVDARVRDLELTFHDIAIEHDITDANIIIEPYASCPYSPPAGKRHLKSIEISAASSIMVNGVTIRMYYTDSEVRSAEVNESTLRIYHYTEGAWQQVPTAVDTANDILTATLSSLSPNGAFGDPPARGVPAFPSVYVGVAAALGAGILAYFACRRLVDQK
jgi:uncharacterized repeat protein (TIGR01451 family)